MTRIASIGMVYYGQSSNLANRKVSFAESHLDASKNKPYIISNHKLYMLYRKYFSALDRSMLPLLLLWESATTEFVCFKISQEHPL